MRLEDSSEMRVRVGTVGASPHRVPHPLHLHTITHPPTSTQSPIFLPAYHSPSPPQHNYPPIYLITHPPTSQSPMCSHHNHIIIAPILPLLLLFHPPTSTQSPTLLLPHNLPCVFPHLDPHNHCTHHPTSSQSLPSHLHTITAPISHHLPSSLLHTITWPPSHPPHRY